MDWAKKGSSDRLWSWYKSRCDLAAFLLSTGCDMAAVYNQPSNSHNGVRQNKLIQSSTFEAIQAD